jgi:hypothetical protein
VWRFVAGYLLGALQLVYLGLQALEFQPFCLELLGLTALGFPSLDLLPMGFQTLFAAPLSLQPFSFLSTRPLLGLQPFGFCGLGSFGGTALSRRSLGFDPLDLLTGDHNASLLHYLQLFPLGLWSLCL